MTPASSFPKAVKSLQKKVGGSFRVCSTDSLSGATTQFPLLSVVPHADKSMLSRMGVLSHTVGEIVEEEGIVAGVSGEGKVLIVGGILGVGSVLCDGICNGANDDAGVVGTCIGGGIPVELVGVVTMLPRCASKYSYS